MNIIRWLNKWLDTMFDWWDQVKPTQCSMCKRIFKAENMTWEAYRVTGAKHPLCPDCHHDLFTPFSPKK